MHIAGLARDELLLTLRFAMLNNRCCKVHQLRSISILQLIRYDNLVCVYEL